MLPKVQSFIKHLPLSNRKYFVRIFRIIGNDREIDIEQQMELLNFLHRFCLVFINLVITAALLVLHIFAAVFFIDYGIDVLDTVAIPVVHLIVSMAAVIMIFVAQVWFFKTSYTSAGENNSQSTRITLISLPMLVNIAYVFSYFMPYMILAFINDPLQASFTYVSVFIVICLFYIVLVSLMNGFMYYIFSQNTRMYVFPVLLAYFSFSYCFVALLSVLSVGSFNDYKQIQTILLPLLIAAFTYLVFKPFKSTEKKTDTQSTSENSQNTEMQDDNLHSEETSM